MVEIKKGNAFKNITGNKYNYLTAISYEGGGTWLWQCDCGNTKILRTGKVTSGQTKSCGCIAKTNALKHGLIGTPEYIVWCNIKARCTNPNNNAYHNYGGRGITMCKEWLISFETFFKEMGNCPIGYTIERTDNNKGYFKDNCTWSSRREQSLNRRSNDMVVFNGISKPLKQWCDELNLNYKRVFARLYQLNWTIEESLK